MLGNSENEAMSLMETMAQNMYGGSVELEVAPVECIDKAGVEAARHRAVAQLALQFQELTVPYFNPKRWYKHFESWLWVTRGLCADNKDPILPDGDSCIFNEDMASKLRKCRAAEEAVVRICRIIGRKSREFSKDIHQDLRRHKSLKAVSKSYLELPGGRRKIRLSYSGVSVEVNEDVYTKLSRLHSEAGSPQEMLLRNTFTLLARYSSAQGTIFRGGKNQAAIPPQAMAILRQAPFNVTGECFASPLNCLACSGDDTASNYVGLNDMSFCSAFSDTDEPFGSLGPFQSFCPTEGSFEANPPFEPVVIASMYSHIHFLLDTAQSKKRSLMFVIIMPCWQEGECHHLQGDGAAGFSQNCKYCTWNQIARSEFMVQSLVLGQGEHLYTEGAQHTKKNVYRVSCQDSSVFVLQTRKAKKTQSLSEESLQSLRESFRPSAAEENGVDREDEEHLQPQQQDKLRKEDRKDWVHVRRGGSKEKHQLHDLKTKRPLSQANITSIAVQKKKKK